jgi:excisionase family DNA binding protein
MIDLSDSTSSTTQPNVRQLAGDRLLVSVVQAAAMLSLSRSSIYQLIWTEQLTAIHIGRSVRLSTDQLEQFVADRLAESRSGR